MVEYCLVTIYHSFHEDEGLVSPGVVFPGFNSANFFESSSSFFWRRNSLALSIRASFCLRSICLRSMISMARVMPSFSANRLYWQYWYIPAEPMTKVPTAQLVADWIGAETSS